MSDQTKALEFMTKVATNGVVYIPSLAYLGDMMGWDLEKSSRVMDGLLSSGKLSEKWDSDYDSGFYRINS